MTITISEEELLGMRPELLAELQTYLREHRDKAASRNRESVHESDLRKSNVLQIPEADLVLSDVGDTTQPHIGVLVEQDDRAYIARRWHLTGDVEKTIRLAIEHGYDRLWRFGHPQDDYFIGGAKERTGAPHIGFSRDHHERWFFVIGQEARPPNIKVITFHKSHEGELTALFGPAISDAESTLTRENWIRENRGGRNLLTHPSDLEFILKRLDPSN